MSLASLIPNSLTYMYMSHTEAVRRLCSFAYITCRCGFLSAGYSWNKFFSLCSKLLACDMAALQLLKRVARKLRTCIGQLTHSVLFIYTGTVSAQLSSPVLVWECLWLCVYNKHTLVTRTCKIRADFPRFQSKRDIFKEECLTKINLWNTTVSFSRRSQLLQDVTAWVILKGQIANSEISFNI